MAAKKLLPQVPVKDGETSPFLLENDIVFRKRVIDYLTDHDPDFRAKLRFIKDGHALGVMKVTFCEKGWKPIFFLIPKKPAPENPWHFKVGDGYGSIALNEKIKTSNSNKFQPLPFTLVFPNLSLVVRKEPAPAMALPRKEMPIAFALKIEPEATISFGPISTTPSMKVSDVIMDFEQIRELPVDPPTMKPLARQPLPLPTSFFLGTVIVPNDPAEKIEKKEPAENETNETVPRQIHPRQFNSPLKLLVVYESGKKLMATVTYTAGARSAIVEPQDAPGAYYLIDARDIPSDGTPIRLDKQKYIRLYHCQKNNQKIKQML